jgi:hypothetical protein
MSSIHKENGGITLEGMLQYADPSATSTWQAENLTPPTGSLPSEKSPMEGIHTGLGIGGMIPGVGVVPDLVDAGLYGAEGDYSGGLLSLLSALPIGGLLAGGGRIARKGAKKIVGGTPKLEGVAGRMPEMAETMPRTSTYQFPGPEKPYVPGKRDKLLERLDSDELDAWESIDIRRQLDELEPGWEREPWVGRWFENLEEY